MDPATVTTAVVGSPKILLPAWVSHRRIQPDPVASQAFLYPRSGVTLTPQTGPIV